MMAGPRGAATAGAALAGVATTGGALLPVSLAPLPQPDKNAASVIIDPQLTISAKFRTKPQRRRAMTVSIIVTPSNPAFV